jgi:hypothetical protein
MSKGDIKWWYEAKNGQKWGWMNPTTLMNTLWEVYGTKAPITKFAAEIGVSSSTVSRWCSGAVEIGVSSSTVSRWCSGAVPMPLLPAHFLHLKHRVLTTIEQIPALTAPWLPEGRSANGVKAADAAPS